MRGRLLYRQPGKTAECLAAHQKALQIRERLARENPSVASYRDGSAESLMSIAILHGLAGRRALALAANQKALAIQESLFRENSNVTGHAIGLAGTLVNVANLKRSYDSEAALENLGRAISILGDVLKREPRNVSARTFLKNAHVSRAKTYDGMKAYERAAEDWEQAAADFQALIEVTPSSRRGALKFRRADMLARAGKHALAAIEIDALLPRFDKPSIAIGFARVYAKCAQAAQNDKTMSEALREVTRDEYVRRASVVIGRLSAKGFFNDAKALAILRDSPEFAPLRDQPEIRKLLKE